MQRIYSTSWLADEEKTISGVAYFEGDKPNPEGYANLFIEDIAHVGHDLGRWYLIIERSEYISDDFAELEGYLLEWAREEGYDLPADGFGELAL